ncbi:hypothetical protein DFH06DRAFT_1137194 [Mycena polygramma]|nr:hypothetical protein DFH06DRAFT_1137194 [Mycena polygramma]
MTRLDSPHEPDGGDEQDVLRSFSRLNLNTSASPQATRSVRPPRESLLHVPPPYATLNPDAAPLAPPSSPPRPSGTQYLFETPTRIGLTTEWSVAGGLTQGVPGTTVRASPSSPKKKKRRPRANVYVVFVGKVPGLSYDWSEARKSVDGVSNSIYRGYRNPEIAEAAYIYAVERSWTRISDSTARAPIPSLPHPEDEEARYNPLHVTEALDDKWYIVYRGICPGVYRSLLESQLNTLGVRGAVHESVEGKDFAFQKFARARTEHMTRFLLPTYHPDVISSEVDPFLYL